MRFDPRTLLLAREGTKLLQHAVLRVLWDVKYAITPGEIARQASLFVNTTPGQRSNCLAQRVLDVLDQQGFVASEKTRRRANRLWHITDLGRDRLRRLDEGLS